jgi:hypothetical protein
VCVDLSFIHFFFHSLTLLLTRHIFPDNLFYLSSFHDITFFFFIVFSFSSLTYTHSLIYLFVCLFLFCLFVCSLAQQTHPAANLKTNPKKTLTNFLPRSKRRWGRVPQAVVRLLPLARLQQSAWPSARKNCASLRKGSSSKLSRLGGEFVLMSLFGVFFFFFFSRQLVQSVPY